MEIMDTERLGKLAAYYADFRGDVNDGQTFGMYCEQERKVYYYYAENVGDLRFSIFSLKNKTVMMGHGTDLYDYGESCFFRVMDMENFACDIMDVTNQRMYSVRKQNDVFQVIDYYNRKEYDFLIIRM